MTTKLNYDYSSLRNHMHGLGYTSWQEIEFFHMHILDYYSSHIPVDGDEDDDVFLAEYDLNKDDFTNQQ